MDNLRSISKQSGKEKGGHCLFMIIYNDDADLDVSDTCVSNSPLILVQNSSKTTKKFFTFDVSTSIRGLHQKKLVLGLLLPVLGAIS